MTEFIDAFGQIMEMPGMNIIIVVVLCLCLILLLRKEIQDRQYKAYLNSDIGKIDQMNGAEFEKYLYDKFKAMGLSVVMTSQTRDFGADLIITLQNGYRIAIQAKRYEEKVSLPAVQEIVASLAYYKCQRGMVITNSEFTENAWILARVNNVILWDRSKLIRNLIDGRFEGFDYHYGECNNVNNEKDKDNDTEMKINSNEKMVGNWY